MKKNFLSVLLMLFLVVMPMSGCQKGDSKQTDASKGEKKITYVHIFSTKTLDPHAKSRYIPLEAGIVETLTKVDKDFKLKPWLLESFNSEDGNKWEFKVKKDIIFHNGKTLDANMVKANIEDVCKKDKGINKTLNIESMKAEGQVLTITLKKPNLSLPSEFSHPNTAIVDVNEDNIDMKPIGTGPFKVEEFKPNASIKLVKNDKYWDGKVKLDEVNFQFNKDANARLQALQSGSADIIASPAPESIEILKKDSNIKIDSVPSLRSHLLLYNMTRPNVNNDEFRKGIDSLINRQEIVDTIMAGKASVANGPFLEKFSFAPQYEKKEFGIENALSHFKKAGLTVEGKKVSMNGNPIKLRIATYNKRPELPQIAQLIQANAKKVGIEIDIKIVENSHDYLTKNNDWDFYVYSLLTAPRGDASYFLNIVYTPEGSLNHGHINDPKLTQVINKFNSCVDEKERLNLAKEATTMIDKSNYNSFIVYPNVTEAYNKRVTGWVTYASEYYIITKDLDVK